MILLPHVNHSGAEQLFNEPSVRILSNEIKHAIRLVREACVLQQIYRNTEIVYKNAAISGTTASGK